MMVRRFRQSGLALLTSLFVVLVSSLLLAASLWYSLSTNRLAWAQSRSEAAMQLAEAGINDELQYITKNASTTAVTSISTAPVAAQGETAKWPGDANVIKGRKGSVDGYTDGSFWVYSSLDQAGTTAWDGRSADIWITAAANVSGSWKKVQVQAKTSSIFSLYGVFALASYTGAPNAVNLNTATVEVQGTAGINGQISNSGGSTITGNTVMNCNTSTHTSNQFTSSNCASGGKLVSVTTPFSYPTTCSQLKRCTGRTNDTDSQAWSYLSSHCSNSTGIYQYKSTASTSTISTSNCTLKGSIGSNLTTSDISTCNTKPGTYTDNFSTPKKTACKTMILTPGDYCFTRAQLDYSSGAEIVIDSQSKCNGGTPGQVRIWVYDSAPDWWDTTTDYCNLPVKQTLATGATTPDPSLTRIYCGTDSRSFDMTRPTSCKNWDGTTLTGDFEYYGGIYAVTKPVTDTTSKTGCQVTLAGTTSSSSKCVVKGSILCDKMNLQGNCKIVSLPSTSAADGCGGAGVVKRICSGG